MTRITLLFGVAALLVVALSAARDRGSAALGERPASGPAPENEGAADVLARLERAVGARPAPFSCN
jgi:hypothetical protein